MTPRSTRSQILGLLAWLALTLLAGGLGAIASVDAASFYAQLNQPAWAPPAGVFGPVWSVLYVLMAVTAWLVWREADSPARHIALKVFGCSWPSTRCGRGCSLPGTWAPGHSSTCCCCWR